jgi:DNA-directed RNA polymerase subunit RPC12/RpoP
VVAVLEVQIRFGLNWRSGFQLQCPKCSQERAHRSHRKGLIERIVSLFGWYPYRCHACNSRFLSRRDRPRTGLTGTEREIRATRAAIKWRARKPVLLAYGSAVIVVLISLYFLLRHGGPAL